MPSFPHLTKKQLEIIELLFSFRFLTRVQLQAFLGHKDYKRLNIWLKYLWQKKYIGRIYEADFVGRTKPAIYYLGLNGIRLLRTRSVEDVQSEMYPVHSAIELRKRYREPKCSRSFIDRCLVVADFVLSGNNAPDGTEFRFKTESEYREDQRYNFLAENDLVRPQLVFRIRQQKSPRSRPVTKHYLLEVFERNLPQYQIRTRIRNYVRFLEEDEWGLHLEGKQPAPVIAIVCQSAHDLLYTRRRARLYIDETWNLANAKKSPMRLTTLESLQAEGMHGPIWENV